MRKDEYVEKVADLLAEGDEQMLEAAARCVLYCSENSIAPSEEIDRQLGVPID